MYRSGITFFDLGLHVQHLLEEGPTVCPFRVDFFVRLTVSPVEAPKFIQFSITERYRSQFWSKIIPLTENFQNSSINPCIAKPILVTRTAKGVAKLSPP